MQVLDLSADQSFRSRRLHDRNAVQQLAALRHLAQAFVEYPESILQELVTAAVDLCGADSAGISIIRPNATDDHFYEWVASAGMYSGFLNALLPKYPSACGITLERGTPQHFRVFPLFFEILGVSAPPVTDGLLLPWSVDGTRGTIFIMAHDRDEAFDAQDVELMTLLADFTAMGMRQRAQHREVISHAGVVGAADMAHGLAHQINNPLQAITNHLYLAMDEEPDSGEHRLAKKLEPDFRRLSEIAKRFLELPFLKATQGRQ